MCIHAPTFLITTCALFFYATPSSRELISPRRNSAPANRENVRVPQFRREADARREGGEPVVLELQVLEVLQPGEGLGRDGLYATVGDVKAVELGHVAEGRVADLLDAVSAEREAHQVTAVRAAKHGYRRERVEAQVELHEVGEAPGIKMLSFVVK